MTDWNEKRVLVTGAGTGIGKGVALEFAGQGANVVLHHCNDIDDDLPPKLKALEQAGRKCKMIFADFNDLDQTRQLGRDACDCLGGIDVLINNSGITAIQPLIEMQPHHYEVLYNVNVRAVYFVTQSVLPTMFEQGKGNVINLSSIVAFEASAEQAVYAGTKGAIMALTRALAVELGPRNIRVNAIAPGCIVVEKYYREFPDFDKDAWARKIPVGFAGEAIDIGRLAVFLASDEARFISGQTYLCDGGQQAYSGTDDGFRDPRPVRWGSTYLDNP
jgi:NAD(P)-dependent dehydrogenase (short-subunit alcohol dehydrogenase family)